MVGYRRDHVDDLSSVTIYNAVTMLSSTAEPWSHPRPSDDIQPTRPQHHQDMFFSHTCTATHYHHDAAPLSAKSETQTESIDGVKGGREIKKTGDLFVLRAYSIYEISSALVYSPSGLCYHPLFCSTHYESYKQNSSEK